MNKLTESKFLELFDPNVHNKVLASAARHPDCEAIVCFENLQMDSSEFGKRAALVVGPSNTFTLAACMVPGFKLGDVPSRFQYPVAYVDYRKALTESQVRGAAGRTYFTLQDEGDYFLFDTRDNGDVGEEEAGQEDIKAGMALAEVLENAFPNHKVGFEVVDEWVHVSINKEPKCKI